MQYLRWDPEIENLHYVKTRQIWIKLALLNNSDFSLILTYIPY